MEKLSIERTIWIAAAPERVWQAITQAEQIQQWWGGGDYWEISALEVGATIKFGKPGELLLAKVGLVEPPHRFRIDWPTLPQFPSAQMSTSYWLEAENGGTRVTVIESGYETLPKEVRQMRFERSSQGYERVLASLKSFIEL